MWVINKDDRHSNSESIKQLSFKWDQRSFIYRPLSSWEDFATKDTDYKNGLILPVINGVFLLKLNCSPHVHYFKSHFTTRELGRIVWQQTRIVRWCPALSTCRRSDTDCLHIGSWLLTEYTALFCAWKSSTTKDFELKFWQNRGDAASPIMVRLI